MATCTSCGGAYIEGAACPARGDGAHTRRRPALPRDEAHSEAVRVHLTPAELRALDGLAKRWRVTRAEAVRRAVAEALERAKRPTPETIYGADLVATLTPGTPRFVMAKKVER